MSDRQINETAKVLIKAKGLIADPEKWCQGGYGFDGGPMCAVGALLRSGASVAELHALDEAACILANREGEPYGASTFNDESGHAAVMQMYDLAISRALQGVES